MKAKGIRCEVDDRGEKIGYKIREARSQRVPYILTVGDKEEEEKTVSARSRDRGELGTVETAAFIETVLIETKERI